MRRPQQNPQNPQPKQSQPDFSGHGSNSQQVGSDRVREAHRLVEANRRLNGGSNPNH